MKTCLNINDNEKGLATEVDDVTTQYKFMHTAGGFVFCIRVSASKIVAILIVTSGFHYSVCKHALKPWLTQHNNTMEEFYVTYVSRKITTERLSEREQCEVFQSVLPGK